MYTQEMSTKSFLGFFGMTMERKECNIAPREYADWLRHLGGVNRYDSPRFVLFWAQYGGGEGSYRAGGRWSVDEAHYVGYRTLLRGDGTPCWALAMWHDAIEYGTPEGYYVSNLDEETGLQTLGEYPYSGRYETLYHLKWWERVDDRIVTHAMPLNYATFERLIPIIQRAKEISWEKTKAAHQALLAKDEEEKERMIERHLHDKAVPFGGNAISFAKQGVRSTAIDQKMIELQRYWNQLQQSAAKLPRGHSTR
jgi:hypothetical protein